MQGVKKTFSVNSDSTASRLDMFLTGQLDISRSRAQKLINGGQVLVNGKKQIKNGFLLKEQDTVQLKSQRKMEKKDRKLKQNSAHAFKKIKIAHRSSDYVVINKPAGILVHPTMAKEANTLADFLLKKFPQIRTVGEVSERPGIVHRLDKDASGLLVAARNQDMFDHLKEQFKKRRVEKHYLVLAHGQVEKDSGVIDFEIDRGKSGKMAARPKSDKLKLKNVGRITGGKESFTSFVVKKRFSRFTLLEVRIKSGRTHQIRVHMFAYGHPVVGDKLYFNKKIDRKKDSELNRLFLHAAKLCFADLSGQRRCYQTGLPEELKKFLSKLN